MSLERLAARFRCSSPAALVAALLIGLLTAQTVTLWHELDPTPHAPDQACGIHIAASVLAGANIGAFELPALVSPDEARAPEYAAPALRIGYSGHKARGPPFAS